MNSLSDLHEYFPERHNREKKLLEKNISKLKQRGFTLFLTNSVINSITTSSCSLLRVPIVDINGKIGFVNKQCEIIIEPVYDKILSAFYTPENIVSVVKDDLWNVIDKDGIVLLDHWSKDIIVPGRDSRMITINSKSIKNIDDNRPPIQISKVRYVGGFRYGFARIHRTEGWGIINEEGREVLPCKYDSMYSFYDYPEPTTKVRETSDSTWELIHLCDLSLK
ncbi:MAG: WG repeat-containing protein [Prevotella sp.]|nr:WG repeat-containing protein [Prevotella sp.]